MTNPTEPASLMALDEMTVADSGPKTWLVPPSPRNLAILRIAALCIRRGWRFSAADRAFIDACAERLSARLALAVSQLKNLSLDDQILVANMILGPATAHDGLVSTLRDHAENVEIRP